MTNTVEKFDPALTHLESIKTRLQREPDVGMVAAAIGEAKEIIQSREGLASNFVFTLGMIPVHFELPTFTAPQVIAAIDSYISFSKAALPKQAEIALVGPPVTKLFVHPQRIEILKRISNENFDLARLGRFCEELNTSYASGSWFSVAMLTRAVLDHVPPIFQCKTFAEVANNYAGSKSFKETMIALETSSRKIADAHLHTQIRKKEVLPNSVQVDCSQSIDVLLGEIIRIL